MEKTFKVLSYNQTDSQGDVFAPGSMTNKEKVPVLKDFDVSKVIGFAKIEQRPDGVFATTELKECYNGMYPGICFQINKSEQSGDIRIIHDIRIMGVGLSALPNPDEHIPPIG
jgi:hypothetical protein